MCSIFKIFLLSKEKEKKPRELWKEEDIFLSITFSYIDFFIYFSKKNTKQKKIKHQHFQNKIDFYFYFFITQTLTSRNFANATSSQCCSGLAWCSQLGYVVLFLDMNNFKEHQP